MPSTPVDHRTFCHISEYKEPGYRTLHAMIASSSRLVLWAPSSVFLKEYSFLEPREFLEYVDEGIIQVVGRERWIMDPDDRNRTAAERFPGAAWDNFLDGTLREWCRVDENSNLAEDQRRVRTAPPECGLAWAEKHLEENPELVNTLGGFADDEVRASAEIPPGTLEAVRDKTTPGDRREFAKWVLRDAYNHGQAIAYTGPNVPFLLARQDGAFLRLLIKLHAEEKFGKTYRARQHEQELRDESQLVDQLVDLLTYLEHRYGRNPTTLKNFIKDGEGRVKLLAWMATLANEVKQRKLSNLKMYLVDELFKQMPDRGPVAIFGQSLASRTAQMGSLSMGAAGAITGVLSGIDPANPLGLISFATGVLSLGAGAIPTGENFLKRIGFFPLDYDEPQWPCTFAFDRPATVKTRAEMRATLKALRERR